MARDFPKYKTFNKKKYIAVDFFDSKKSATYEKNLSIKRHKNMGSKLLARVVKIKTQPRRVRKGKGYVMSKSQEIYVLYVK